MSDEQDDSNGVVGWILGLAVTLAIVVALLSGVLGALGGNTASPAAPAAGAAPSASPAATGAPAAAKLYFDVGAAAAPADAAQAIAAMVEHAKASPNSKLSISGFHDKTGDVAQNAELAKNRALAVKALLISAGVPEDRIMMQKPVETTGGADDKEARRVEVSAVQ